YCGAPLIFAGLVSAVAISAAAPACSARSAKDAAAAAAAIKDIEKDRADSEAWLKSNPVSYLATIDRRDFEDQTTMTVGRAADNDLRIDDATVSAHHLRVTVQGDSFHVEGIDPEARFTVKDEKKEEKEQREA